VFLSRGNGGDFSAKDSFYGFAVSMPSAFQWLRRFYAFGVSVASPFLASLFECFTFQWLTPFMKIQL